MNSSNTTRQKKASVKVLELLGQTSAPAASPSRNQAAVNHKPPPTTRPTPQTRADDNPNPAAPKGELEQANLLLSQITEKQGRLDQAIGWLQLADPKQAKLAVQNQRAQLLARTGKLDQARQPFAPCPKSSHKTASPRFRSNPNCCATPTN